MSVRDLSLVDQHMIAAEAWRKMAEIIEVVDMDEYLEGDYSNLQEAMYTLADQFEEFADEAESNAAEVQMAVDKYRLEEPK